MELGNDHRTADRDTLIGNIICQQAIIESLEKRIAGLKRRGKSKGAGRMPGLKPKAGGKPDQPRKPRKRRPHGFARTLISPTQRAERVLQQRPDCGTELSGAPRTTLGR